MEQEINEWDGFGFFIDKDTKQVAFEPFNIKDALGSWKKPEDAPADRDSYHVLLVSGSVEQPKLMEVFTSHFLDAKEYAKHRALDGFRGVMVKSYHPLSNAFMQTASLYMSEPLPS